jgi:ribosomal protein L14E/L6E/L27E
MDSSDEIAIGQVVKSRAGRDKGRIFLVLDTIDHEHLLVVDGDLRKLDKPKKKKVKHLIIYNTVVDGLNYKLENKMKINNAYIRKLLEPFNKSF